LLILFGAVQVLDMLGFHSRQVFAKPLAVIAPFEIVNTYGLFAVMTTTRPEIILEGSNDQVTWREYSFPYKPGNLHRALPFVAPYQPRLDWQMWFAALASYEQAPWFERFCYRLLEGSPPVLNLLATNPFPGRPPRFVRAVAYRYHMADMAAHRSAGLWWVREEIGPFSPVLSIR
jgi:hypothetical protein